MTASALALFNQITPRVLRTSHVVYCHGNHSSPIVTTEAYHRLQKKTIFTSSFNPDPDTS